MKKNILFPLFALLVAFCATSCRPSNTRTLTSATGSIYECLVVIPDKALSDDQLIATQLAGLDNPASPYNDSIATCYDLVKVVMGADMPCMPQMEPYFKLTRVAPTTFDNMLRPTRNILIVDVDEHRFTKITVHAATDVWSHPQAVYTIQAPTWDDFVAYWLAHGTEVRDWFVKKELERQASFYQASTNHDARAVIQKKMYGDLWVSEDYMLILDTTLVAEHSTLTDEEVRLVWCCNNKGSLRRDLILYSYPYTQSHTFTLPFLCQQRDAILSQVVHAQVEGTYMGTEYHVFPPQMREVTVQKNHYAVEVRGLWKMYGGEAMGGPFVSLTRLDEVHNRVVTEEVFVFAPGQKKRNALRQAEAMLYTFTFPSDTIESLK